MDITGYQQRYFYDQNGNSFKTKAELDKSAQASGASGASVGSGAGGASGASGVNNNGSIKQLSLQTLITKFSKGDLELNELFGRFSC